MNRNEALLRANIPCLLFFKSKGYCEHCDKFMPYWEALTNDPELHNKIAFIIYSFGSDPVSGKTFQVAPEYVELLSRGKGIPFFAIHLPPPQGKGINESEIINMQNGPPNRNYENMKKAIIMALYDTPYRI